MLPTMLSTLHITNLHVTNHLQSLSQSLLSPPTSHIIDVESEVQKSLNNLYQIYSAI